MRGRNKADITIVGAGILGLLGALELVQRGCLSPLSMMLRDGLLPGRAAVSFRLCMPGVTPRP